MPAKNNTEIDFLQSPWKAFWFALEGQRGKLLAMYLCLIIGNVGAFSIPYFLKLIVDRISAPDTAPLAFSVFAIPILLISAVVIGQELFYRSGHILETIIAVKAFDRITSSLYKTLLQRPAAYFEETFAGELSWRITQIGSATKFFIDSFPWEIGWPVVASIVTIFLLSIANIWLVVVFVVWLALFLLFSYFFLRLHYRAIQTVAKTYADLNGSIVDTLGNMPVVHAFGAEKHEYDHYRTFMDPALKAERWERKILVINKLHQGLSFVLLCLSLTLTSVLLFIKGNLTVGNFIIVAATIPSFANIIWNFGEIVIRGIRNYGEFKNAIDSLHTTIPSTRGGDQELESQQTPIVFSHISFSYPGSTEKVFDDLNLEIKSGQKVGLVGKSGAGKSTLIKLLLRSYDPTAGVISIGTQNTTTLKLDSLRGTISFVPQDTTLFHRTLYENIIYARPDALKEDVVNASKRAHADDFIEKCPEKYETMVGERGIKLSGGQRQRIAIARAMLKNSPILILDEATSSLDSESEEIVQVGLQELFQGRTTIAIAHRLSTLRSMDRIIVLEKGRIIEDGSPQDLLKKENGEFKRIWDHQKNGFV